MKKGHTIVAQTPTPGKKGIRIDREKYNLIRDAIVASLQEREEVAFRELSQMVAETLAEPFDGSIGWYTTTVKLDLEVRGIVERVPGSKPQRLRLKRS